MPCYHLHITGKVQGVGFRVNAQYEAQKLGLHGWVRNTANGAVEALAVGSQSELDAFLKWCHKGPLAARVENVTVQIEPENQHHDNSFHIIA